MNKQPVALITGVSSGVGYATTLKFLSENIYVAGTARRAERLEQLQQHSENFLPIIADVRDASAMQAAVDQTIEQFGRLDLLIANAGLGHRGSIIESNWQDIKTLLDTNIDGVLHSVRAAVPRMQDGGQVILISSIAARMITPYAGFYAASKAFISSLGRALRLELESRHIAVTDILLGRVQTEFNEKRLGQPGRGGSFPPAMPVENAANAIFRAYQKRPKQVVVRWVDRLMLWGNIIIPEWIGRKAMKQYKG
ncbi:MAG: hypothetical protein Kow00117_03330 [Phototrophicales bacterium]